MKLLSPLVFLALMLTASAADYNIITSRSVRPDDTTLVRFPEVFNSIQHPASDLIRLKPDGTVEVVVPGNGKRLFDPKMSLDGTWIYYVSSDGTKSDIYRTNGTQTVRLTDATNGVYNLGPCPVPGGRVCYTSNRRGYVPIKGYTSHNQQLHILDDIPGETDTDGETGRNIECTGHLNLGAALHPTLLTTGKILWSTNESQGLHDKRSWGLWTSYPDGRKWEPFHSAFAGAGAWHFQTQLSNGDVVAALYYNLNNNGTGALYGAPLNPEAPQFLSPKARNNPPLPDPLTDYKKIWLSTMRRGTYAVTPFTGPEDVKAAKDASGEYMGKVTHPSGAPNNDLLCVWSPGPCNLLYAPTTPMFHFQVGIIKGVANTPQDIEILLDDPGYNYTQPIAEVPWTAIHAELPPEIPFNPNETATPFGIVGSSSAHIGQWKPQNPEGLWWNLSQGFWTGPDVDETGADLSKIPAGIDIVATEPNRPVDKDWRNTIANERLRLLARVKFDETDRPQGDTSWSVKIPADVPFTFRTFDSTGRTVTFGQTWHQLRPGEARLDCGGCHNHAGNEIKWEDSFSFSKPPKDFRDTALRTPEFNRDVLPIFQAKCWDCHNPANNPPIALDASIAGGPLLIPAPGFSFGAHSSRLSRAIHGEGTIQMPKDRPALSDAEKLLIDEWIDYFCLISDHPEASGQGGFRDNTPPTLYVSRSKPLKIGAYDYFSGLASVTVNGQPVTLTDHVWTGDAIEGENTIEATDNAGNKITTKRTFRGSQPEMWNPADIGPPFNGDNTLRVRNGIIEKVQ